jgi:hypothetical protein
MRYPGPAMVAAIVIFAAAMAMACSFNTAKKAPADGGAHPLAEGETIGTSEHVTGGTTVASSVITLLTMTCTNGRLVVDTNLKTITGKMDCAQEVPQATLEHFYGQAVGISYAGGRLRIESASAGTIDLAVRDAASADIHATP